VVGTFGVSFSVGKLIKAAMSLPSGFWRQASYHCPEEFDYLTLDAELRIGVVSLTHESDPVKRAPGAFRYQELGDGKVLLQLKRSEKWTEESYYFEGDFLWWRNRAKGEYQCWSPVAREDLPEWWPRLHAMGLKGLLPS